MQNIKYSLPRPKKNKQTRQKLCYLKRIIKLAAQNLPVEADIFKVLTRNNYQLKILYCPSWCGSDGWSIVLQTQGSPVDCQSGYMPGLQVQSPFGVCASGSPSTFLSHIDVSLPLALLSPFSRLNKRKKNYTKLSYNIIHIKLCILPP